MKRYTLEQIRGYLKDKITYSWYVNAKIDYNIDGRFIDCGIDENRLVICWEEDGKKYQASIGYYDDYTLEQLYYIWQEAEWEEVAA